MLLKLELYLFLKIIKQNFTKNGTLSVKIKYLNQEVSEKLFSNFPIENSILV